MRRKVARKSSRGMTIVSWQIGKIQQNKPVHLCSLHSRGDGDTQ